MRMLRYDAGGGQETTPSVRVALQVRIIMHINMLTIYVANSYKRIRSYVVKYVRT